MRKIFSLIVSLMLLSIITLSSPLRNIPQKLIQPDGTVVNCFASGDEFYHWLHDKEGYTITFNRYTKYWVYAEKKQKELVPSNYIVGKDKPQQIGIQKWLMPDYTVIESLRNTRTNRLYKQDLNSPSGNVLSKGTINNIVIFIRFKDQEEFSKPLSYYQNYFFDGSSESSVSFKNYFKSVSYNQLTINSSYYPKSTGDLILSYQDIHTRNYYCNKTSAPDSGYANVEEGYARLSVVGKKAVEFIASQVPTDLNIDSNNDGNIDNLVFLIAGAADGWTEVLWPIQGHVDFTTYINGKKADVFNQQFDDNLSVSVLSHEMFHTFGAPDLYHYKPESKDFKPVGEWDLMESDGNQNMVAYMKYRYGKWINTIPEVTQSGTYTLNPLGGNDTINVCYKIKSPNSTKEYFMIEYRDKRLPFETNIPSSGILIYRINPDSSGLGNRNGPPDEVYIYRPGGTPTLNGNVNCAAFTPDSNRVTFNDQTNPSCFLTNGTSGGISISNIKINGATATFDFIANSTSVETGKEIPEEFTLSQNYPNPFNPTTTINFQIPKASHVELKVFDLLGREITTLVNGEMTAGNHEIKFDGSKLSSGVYFYRMSAGNFAGIKKLLLMK